MKFATIGFVCSLTRDRVALLDTLVDELKQLLAKNPDTEFAAGQQTTLTRAQGLLSIADGELDDATAELLERDADGMIEEIENWLGYYAPPYCYFGLHSTEGYGFWIDWSSLNDDSRGRDAVVLRVNSGDEWPELSGQHDYVLEINDHGNATLFTAQAPAEELWSCV
jgi:hypothetical protein